ncbi:MBL fold metallo-hydrolase [Microbacterium imperiale]|uniref:MBL fold metallo-hydrolase n=1 Tax=Microbacterium imperiale TaxID=33884 RepID=A0A9W6M232_9MICO|nr:MBL fold metallo-hydrolase [Microbacterium imperiale]MBP2419621.1 L-ascorbate metabolism protein UlaG (beta-lactamase superfamily) [Microbacterium imperiale]MDS0198513.1 MBL fold metallo-hydrolase [Microbacterium imperiale]BFE39962.1 MBL fold metallo-hydrolase [Microbacterium imperiale]GLJ79063.1 MBL fold metallo-hydrolase [Microbacterium imperiale]
MHVTKHEHACVRLERDGKTLLIDPGMFTEPLADLHGLAAVVITHEHPDHWTSQHLARILEEFPSVPIYGPEGVVRAAAGFDIREVSPGDELEAGPFRLKFFGGRHAVIHESIPVIDNVGVLVDDEFYYPGDSYAVPKGADVTLLAAPVGAPWLKIGDAMNFVLAVKPRRVFATHDMTLSPAGLAMGRERLTWAAAQNGGEFVALDPGDATDL